MANAKKKPAVFLESFCGLYPAEAISFRLGGAAEGGASVLRHKIRAAHGAAALGKGAAVFLIRAGVGAFGEIKKRGFKFHDDWRMGRANPWWLEI